MKNYQIIAHSTKGFGSLLLYITQPATSKADAAIRVQTSDPSLWPEELVFEPFTII